MIRPGTSRERIADDSYRLVISLRPCASLVMGFGLLGGLLDPCQPSGVVAQIGGFYPSRSSSLSCAVVSAPTSG